MLIVVLTAAVFLIVYSARIESGDALMLLDTVSSWVDYGDFRLDLAAWHRPPPLVGNFDLVSHDIEPLPIIAAAPLYVIAKLIPNIGMIHTLYLFNVIVCALACGVMFQYALDLGASMRVAVVTAISFGVGTILFPYSKSFFREPLLLLMLLISGLSIERIRASGYRISVWWILAVLTGIGAILTKTSGFVAIPALLLIAVPPIPRFRVPRWLIQLIVAVALIGIAALILARVGVLPSSLDLIGRVHQLSAGNLLTALAAYLISPNGSVWGTSPILLLAIPGAWIALKQGTPRYTLVVLLMLLGFAVGYAVLSGVHWFGGLSTPPRFLMPVVPFLLLTAIPAIERILRSRNTFIWIGFALLCVYSLWWQITAVSYWWGVYPQRLPPESNSLLEWLPAMYDPRYLRPVVLSSVWGTLELDFAWVALRQAGWGIAFGGVALVCLAGMVWMLRRGRSSRWLWILPILCIGLSAGYMTALYADDDRYDANNTPLIAMLDTINVETTADDVILLSSPRYQPFFSNAYRGSARVIALSEQPGEQPSETQPPQIRSDNPDMLVTPITIPLIHRLASEQDRLWLLVEFSPELAWSVRPVERFMTAHYYPIRQFQMSPTVRLIEFSTADAPDPFGFRGADIVTDLRYGDSLRLEGLTLPHGMDGYSAGDALPVSLYWSLDAPTDARYTVALFLRDTNGMEVTQNDWQPAFGFAPTDTWTPNLPVWDNRALRIPNGLPAGEYQLWVKVYGFVDGSPRDLPVTGSATLDGVIGVLPVRIQVE